MTAANRQVKTFRASLSRTYPKTNMEADYSVHLQSKASLIYRWSQLRAALFPNLSDPIPGSLKAPRVAQFLTVLSRTIPKDLLVIRVRLPAHRSRLVRESVESRREFIGLAHLSLYTPELNPAEYTCAYLKDAGDTQPLRQRPHPAKTSRRWRAALNAASSDAAPAHSRSRRSYYEMSPIYERLNNTGYCIPYVPRLVGSPDLRDWRLASLSSGFEFCAQNPVNYRARLAQSNSIGRHRYYAPIASAPVYNL